MWIYVVFVLEIDDYVEIIDEEDIYIMFLIRDYEI